MRTRRLIAAAFVIPLFLLSPAVSQAHPKPIHVIRVAPADEYFGRLKMSILGIRNQLRDLALRAQYTPDRSADVLGAAYYVEDALHDWEHKYPADPWLAKSVYELTSLYALVHSAAGQQDTARAFNWLENRYARSVYALRARTELADTLK